MQVINLILPRRVNVRRKSAWYAKGGEQPDMSPEDAQVRGSILRVETDSGC